MTSALAGKRALIVEDEGMLRLQLADTLEEMGCQVADMASTLADAESVASTTSADFALLDLNLHGRLAYPVADILVARGIPFVFSTGYGSAGVEPRFHGTPALRKPFEAHDLMAALVKVLG